MSENKIIITGLLLPKDRVSRNKVLYDWSSIKSNYKKLIGLPLLYNHLNEGDKKPIGKFIDSYLKENDDKDGIAGWYYKADVNPKSEYADSVVRGDLSKVSIQVMAENQRKEQASDGTSYTRAYISDVLEGSVVPTPGYMETSINIVREQFNQSDMILSESFKVIQKKESTRDIITEIDGKKKILTVSGSGFRAVDEDGVTYINVKGEWQKEKFRIMEYVEPANENEVNLDELQMGIEVELEHTDDIDEAKTIALQHLAEMPDYYTRLAKMENEAKEEKEQITTDNVPTQTKIVAKEYTDSDLEDAYQKLQSKDKVKKYILLRDLGKTHNDAINTIIRESFSSLDRLYESVCKESTDTSFGFHNKDHSKTAVGDKWETSDKYYVQFYSNGSYIRTIQYNTKDAAIRAAKKYTESMMNKESFLKESLKEAKDKNGKGILGGSRVKTPEGKMGYVYQIMDDDEIRVTSKPQTGLLGWYKASELEVIRESFSSFDKLYEKVCKEGFLEIPDMYENTVKTLGIKYSKTPNDTLIVSDADVVKKTLNKAKIPYFEESLSNESVLKENIYSDYKIGSIVKYKGKKYEIVEFEDDMHSSATLVPERGGAKIRGVNLFNLPIVEESLSNESVLKENIYSDYKIGSIVKYKGKKYEIVEFEDDYSDSNINSLTVQDVAEIIDASGYGESISKLDKLHESVCREASWQLRKNTNSTKTWVKNNDEITLFDKGAEKDGYTGKRFMVFDTISDKSVSFDSLDKANIYIKNIQKESISNKKVMKEDYDPNDGFTHYNNIKKSIDRLKQNASELHRGDLWRKFDDLLSDVKKTINKLDTEFSKQN